MIMEIHAGDVLRGGRYEIQRLLRSAPDKGIYLAHDRVLDRPVVVDVFSNNSIMPNGLTVSAWEARVLGKLDDHPNIATAQDYWEEGETAVMVSRYLSGGTLLDRIADSRESGTGLPVEQILKIAIEIACGLEHIHGRRILYRDLQPRNVLFDEWGTVHLVDFDTAVSLDDREMSDLSHRPVIDHMAPELTDGAAPTNALTFTRWGQRSMRCARGVRPSPGLARRSWRRAAQARPRPWSGTTCPEALKDLVFCLLAPDCDQRPASAAEVVKRLEDLRTAWAAPEPPAPTPRDSQSLPRPDAAELRASAEVKAADYAVGDVIDDRFEIVGMLGQGGFSKVYRVRDEVEDEERALKLFDNARGYEAVRREIGALRKIRHPNVVEVYWAGKTSAGDWYLITEFIEGEPLSEFTGGNTVLRDREAVDVALTC